MLPVYKSLWNDDEQPQQKLTQSLCSWSCKNWVAYTTGHENENPKLDVNTVYIMDPDQPWEMFTVNTFHRGIIEHLEWDNSGNSFVTVDTNGVGKIWRQEGSVVNQWKCQDSEVIQFSDGSRIGKLLWFDETKHFNVDIEMVAKREWFQKFSHLKNESLANSTGETNSGFVVITSEGHIKVFILRSNQKPLVYTSRLGSLKSSVLMTDFIVNDAGKMFVALVTNPCMVELFSVSFKEVNSNIEITVEIWPCIVPYTYGDANFEQYKIEAIKCVKKCSSTLSSDQVLVLSKSATASSVKSFEIRKEPVILHTRFPTQQQAAQQFADTCCCLKTVQLAGAEIKNMFITNLHFANFATISDISLLPKLVLVDSSGAMHVYSIPTFQQLLRPTLVKALQEDNIDSATFSSTDHALFAVSQCGNPMMFMLPHYANCTDKIKVKNIVSMLQWSIMESHIPWDVMLFLSSVEKSLVDQCLQQFVSDFTESTGGSLQYLFFWGYWNTKALFYSVGKDYCGVFESYNMLFLHSVHLYFVAHLAQSEKEVILLDKINTICTASKKEFELAKVLQVLDVKDMVFSSLNNAEQALIHRPIIQWLTDYMVHVVRLVLSTNHHKQDWKVILQYFDSSSFLCLRKLCILLFILYQKNTVHNIQPIYVTLVNSSEVLPQLFKLVSKLYAASLGDTSFGDIVMADLPFSSLPIMYLEYPLQNPRGGVLCQTTLSSTNKDFNYYDIQLKCDNWELIHNTASGNPLMTGILSVNTQLRQIYDGINFTQSSLMQGELVKQCCRCGTLTIYNCHTSRLLNELWSSCWSEHCVCGGLWKKVL